MKKVSSRAARGSCAFKGNARFGLLWARPASCRATRIIVSAAMVTLQRRCHEREMDGESPGGTDVDAVLKSRCKGDGDGSKRKERRKTKRKVMSKCRRRGGCINVLKHSAIDGWVDFVAILPPSFLDNRPTTYCTNRGDWGGGRHQQ